jgi:hypothetical protein
VSLLLVTILHLIFLAAEEGVVLQRVATTVLQDTQARLVFRAQNFIRSDLQMFTPTPDDVDYPNRLKSELICNY